MKKIFIFAFCCLLVMACGGKSESKSHDYDYDDDTETTEKSSTEKSSTVMPEGEEVETVKELNSVMSSIRELEHELGRLEEVANQRAVKPRKEHLIHDISGYSSRARRLIDRRCYQLQRRLNADDSRAVRDYCDKEYEKLDEYTNTINKY